MISIEEFKKVELKVGRVVSAERLENSEKLLKFKIQLGEEERQILSGIAKYYEPESLIGKEVVIVANLAPRMMAGHESNGMILMAEDEAGTPILLQPEKIVPTGCEIN